MPCIKTNVRNTRLKKKYSLVRNVSRPVYVAEKSADIENLLVYIENSDVVSFVFDTAFPDTPSIVASFVSVTPAAIVNVFIESASSVGATIRTSAPTTGFISVQAMYIEGCEAQDYTFAPVVTVPPVMGPAISGSPPSITAPVVIANPSSTAQYTLYVNGLQVPGYVNVDLASLSSYTYQVADIGTLTYIDATVTNSKGAVSSLSNSVVIA